MVDYLTEVEKKPHTKCPVCRHLVPVLAENGIAFIAGHHYLAMEQVEETERRSQRGGPDIRSFRTVDRQSKKFCAGGSFRIVGIVDGTEEVLVEDAPVRQIPMQILYTPPRLRSTT